MNAVHPQLHTEGRTVPWTQLCRLLGVPRPTLYYQAHPRQRDEAVDEPLAAQIKEIIEKRPAFGVRRVHVQLTKARGLTVNRKKVRRIMRLKRWTMPQRPCGRRPRAEKRRSIPRPARLTVERLMIKVFAQHQFCHEPQPEHAALDDLRRCRSGDRRCIRHTAAPN